MFVRGKLANIRLGWKGFLGAKTLAYCENSQLRAVKSFITLVTGDNIIKHFTAVIYKFS